MKKFYIIFIVVCCIICLSCISFSQDETENIEETKTVENSDFNTGIVTTESLKIRSGLGTENAQIGLLAKGETVHIYDKIDNWYIIRTDNNLVGAVSSDYIDTDYDNTIETASTTILSQEEQIFFNLINNKRIENNLPEFEIDETLLNIARLKANDIVQNNYFSHTSPTYGTFFEMLKNNNVSYSKASENIARDLTAENAIQNLMNSESHKNNILSQDFNYTGIAVVDNPKYGKIFVEIFVAR